MSGGGIHAGRDGLDRSPFHPSAGEKCVGPASELKVAQLQALQHSVLSFERVHDGAVALHAGAYAIHLQHGSLAQSALGHGREAVLPAYRASRRRGIRREQHLQLRLCRLVPGVSPITLFPI